MKTAFFGALVGCAICALPGSASTINVDFSQPDAGFNQGVSTTASYTLAGGLKIIATGYHGTPSSSTAGTPTALYAKTLGGDETGLGLLNDPAGQHEITPGNFIQLDLSQLVRSTVTSFSLSIDSSTGTETYGIYRSTAAGIAGTLYQTGSAETSYLFTEAQIAADPFVSLTANSGNVLLGPGTVVTTTPEPGTLLSMGGAGLALLGIRLRRKSNSLTA